MSWDRFLTNVILTLGCFLAVAYAFILVMNPYGHLPWHPFGAHVIMDNNQRFQYPAIARSLLFDSAVIGTSTSRLLDPDRLDTALGGHFANLAMNAAWPWEQYQMTLLFFRHQRAPRTLLFGLDWLWCDDDADLKRITPRGFPDWMYDQNPWNDWQYLLNPSTLEFAGRLALHRLGLKPPRIPFNGFEIFVPPDSAYDAAKAAKLLWSGLPGVVAPIVPAYAATDAEMKGWRFPALAWLAELLDMAPPGTRVILAFMPSHVSKQPVPGSRDAAHERTCKARVAELAWQHRAIAVDFNIRSPITLVDTHFWDQVHYRLPIGYRIIDGIAKAVETRLDDPHGDWVILVGATTASPVVPTVR